MDFKIKFSGKSHDYTEDEIDTVITAMKKAEPYTQGNYLKAFEKKICGYLGGEHAFAVNNATSALEMAAQICRFQKGDEVIIPAHTFTASAYPFAKRGASLVWADIDPDTRVVTADLLAEKITARTKAIVVVHLYGYTADMPAIASLAKANGIMLIEDAAQSMGTSLNGRMSGTFGDIGVFSLHSHKNITTLGEGGVLVVRDPVVAEIVPMLRHNGHCPFPSDRECYWKPAMGDVDFPEIDGQRLWPNNFCMGEVECALGSKMIDRIDNMNAEKRSRAMTFIDAMDGYDHLVFHREDSARHNYHLLAARVDGDRRDELIGFLAFEKGIQCVVQYCPLYRYPFYRKLGLETAHCPNTDRFFDHMISFPFHHWMADADFEYMIDAVKEALERIG